jgi:probable rRNA maturation factor
VICTPLIALEAQQQNKQLFDHWAHITIHGVLHLLGYDHIDDAEAEEMEALEIKILSRLNINNPYLEESTQ